MNYPDMMKEWGFIVDMCKPTANGGAQFSSINVASAVRRNTIVAIDGRIKELEAIVDDFAKALDEIFTNSEETYASQRAAEALGLI